MKKTFFAQFKIFILTSIAMFAITSLLHLGIRLRLPSLSVESRSIDKNSVIEERLNKKPNTFEVKKSFSAVQTSFASSFYENAHAFIVVDFDTGEILFEKSAEEKFPIASLTKIMTAVVALDLVAPNELFTVSKKASKIPPTRIGVVPGEKMKLSELLNALLLTSANDAAEVIKEGIDLKYSSQVFIDAMNNKAKIIGLENTHFSNPQGFDNPNNYSTAFDLAILSRYALTHYPEIGEIVKKDYVFYPADSNHKQFDLYNWNGLLGVYPGVIGFKIGNTDDAGYTMSSVAKRGDKTIIVILLGAPGVLERDVWTSQLLDSGFEKAESLPRIALAEDSFLKKYKTWKYWN